MNILLQGYICRWHAEDFALVSDTAYVAQNGGRIVRAMLEIATRRKWAYTTTRLLELSKSIEKQLWSYEQPLRQFDLKPDVLYALDRYADEYTVSELAAMEPADLGHLIHSNEQHGRALVNAAKQLPAVDITYKLRPIGHDLLRISVRTRRHFEWNTKVHGTSEPFSLWVEDHDGVTILHLVELMFHPDTIFVDAEFVITIHGDTPPESITIRYLSDRWLGAELDIPVKLESLKMPAKMECQTKRHNLPFLPISAVVENSCAGAFSHRFQFLNAIQTQVAWGLLRTTLNTLVCAPSGCGKTLLVELLIS